MIYEIIREVAAVLEAKKVAHPLAYGPERFAPTTVTSTRIQIDEEGDDSFEPAKSDHKNPKHAGVWQQSCVLRVFAQETVSGARLEDHRRLARQLVALTFVALRRVIGARKNTFTPASGRFLKAEELPARGLVGLEQWPGVVYEMPFLVDRGIPDVDFVGAARPTAGLDAIASRTSVKINGVGDETACGA